MRGANGRDVYSVIAWILGDRAAAVRVGDLVTGLYELNVFRDGANQPAQVAQKLVDGRFTYRYDLALQAVNEVPYDKWREYDPEDTLRYYALRLHEAGAIKSTRRKSYPTVRIGAF
jgi:hypothetical protein